MPPRFILFSPKPKLFAPRPVPAPVPVSTTR